MHSIKAGILPVIQERPDLVSGSKGKRVKMARVQQSTIDKTVKTIGVLMTSPAFPSRDELLESNTILCNVVTMVRGACRGIPEKTVCGLLVQALEIDKDVSGEALWKRYRRSTVTSGIAGVNRNTVLSAVSAEKINDNINRAGSGVNRDTVSGCLFIPTGISQIDLAAGLAEFFESHSYDGTALLRTFLMTLKGLSKSMPVSKIKDAIDRLVVSA
jgi:hypothetical protein